MNMLKVVVCVALCGVVLVGCSSPPSYHTSPAVGVWMAPGEDEDEPAFVMHFKADGTFFGQADVAKGGSYTIKGNDISGYTEGLTFIGTIEGNTMRITDSKGNKVTLTRQ
jgi:hypothetical protein